MSRSQPWNMDPAPLAAQPPPTTAVGDTRASGGAHGTWPHGHTPIFRACHARGAGRRPCARQDHGRGGLSRGVRVTDRPSAWTPLATNRPEATQAGKLSPCGASRSTRQALVAGAPDPKVDLGMPAFPPGPATSAPSHPLVLGAAGLLVLNDFVLRGWAPGWFTGKASDVAWLVLVPVVLAAAAARCGVTDRVARLGSLVVTAAVFVTLQLWAPLGALVRGDHVADVGDLLALPAILGAVVAWRGAGARRGTGRGAGRGAGQWASLLALPVLGGALVADSFGFPPSVTWPCAAGMQWDTADPLVLRLSAWGWAPVDTDAFLRGTHLVDAAGVEVPLVAGRGDDAIYLCARDGLRGDTDYTWTVGPWDERSSNQASYTHDALPTVTFRTTAGDGPPVATAAACVALVVEMDSATRAACDPWDTGPADTGSDTAPADTGPPDTAGA